MPCSAGPGAARSAAATNHPERDLQQLLARRAQPRAGEPHRVPVLRTFGSAELTYSERVERHFAALEERERTTPR